MCTAISYRTKHHYFGRNLDLERGYGESVVITPRNFPFHFRFLGDIEKHYAMIGMAAIVDGYPLYFEATNENGLSMAGLHFPKNTFYEGYAKGKENIAPFELIPYLLGTCSSVKEVRHVMKHVQIVNCNFSDTLPVTPLHWMISDRKESVTLECTKTGMWIYENKLGVLTNDPPFYKQIENLNEDEEIPGDYSSKSRFKKAVYLKEHSVCNGDEQSSVNQFFHMLQAVAMVKGCVKAENGELEYTRYSSCCNTDRGVYYWTTYDNFEIQKVDMHAVDLDDKFLSRMYTDSMAV